LRARALTFGVGLILFVAIDVTLAVRASGHLRAHFWNYPDDDPNALRVEVTARQWAWTFRTAGPDGRFATPDDVVTLGELHVPIGRPIYLKLRSKDVVHSLYLPNFRTKIDAIPGTTTRLWFQAQDAGRYEIGCAQHCGVSHYKMRGWLIATTDDDYRAWLVRAETDSRLRYDPADAAIQDEGWAW
jgi:cytochrome c oxidase subunit 2